MIRILHVVGARPNFMKIAPIMSEIDKHPEVFEQVLVHTGQHYDEKMSKVFFDDLGMPLPDINLEIGSGSHAWQTAQIMLKFEPTIQEYRPDAVVVPGDVNSTLGCALVASKIGIPIVHVEAGLRSFDRTMPEEINRVLTDQISSVLLTPSPECEGNLLREGIPGENIFFVGNVMIDTLKRLLPRAQERIPALAELMPPDGYVLVTLHRPSNVDEPETLHEIMRALLKIGQNVPVVFPVHPRTTARLQSLDLNLEKEANLHLIEPLSYLDFLAFQSQARLVITDSGGVQEETTYLGIPCLTVRPNTERPVTIELGTNRLVASTCQSIVEASTPILADGRQRTAGEGNRPELWDGISSQRIVSVLREVL